MRDEPRMIFTTAAAAAEAVDFILDCTWPVEPRHRPGEDGAA
jgi:hypothetical protein